MNDEVKPVSTIDELKKKIDEEKSARANMAAEAINAILKDNRCVLLAQPYIDKDGRILSSVAINPLD